MVPRARGAVGVSPRSGDVRIRLARAEDLPALERLEADCFPLDADASVLWDALRRPRTCALFVAERDGRILGDALVDFSRRGQAYLTSLATAPAAQGSGIGRALLAVCIRTAADRGCARIVLDVRAANAGARRLYETAGFSPTMTRRDYYGSGAHAVRYRMELGAR